METLRAILKWDTEKMGHTMTWKHCAQFWNGTEKMGHTWKESGNNAQEERNGLQYLYNRAETLAGTEDGDEGLKQEVEDEEDGGDDE